MVVLFLCNDGMEASSCSHPLLWPALYRVRDDKYDAFPVVLRNSTPWICSPFDLSQSRNGFSCPQQAVTMLKHWTICSAMVVSGYSNVGSGECAKSRIRQSSAIVARITLHGSEYRASILFICKTTKYRDNSSKTYKNLERKMLAKTNFFLSVDWILEITRRACAIIRASVTILAALIK